MDHLRYQIHLDRVSRSFAFCIARLDGDLRGWVGLSYLLCRILDTVEDAPWTNPALKEKAFLQFEAFLNHGATDEEVKQWLALFPEVPEGEYLLLADSVQIFSDLHSLPASVLEKIRRPVLNMYRGMKFFARKQVNGQGLRLRSLAEVNQYCFFVAGIVGGLLTELMIERLGGGKLSARNLVDAHHFGLFLQKINLLKDQSEDEKEGRFLVPSRTELLASMRADAEGAIRYLTSLPIAEKGFRLFCAWSLFIGLRSMPWVESSWAKGVFNKIPRWVTEKLLGQVEKMIDDNRQLLELFQSMVPAFPKATPSTGPRMPLLWMEQVYEGGLGQEEFAQLGLLPSA